MNPFHLDTRSNYDPWTNYLRPDAMVQQKIGDATTTFVTGATLFWFAILAFGVWVWMTPDEKK